MCFYKYFHAAQILHFILFRKTGGKVPGLYPLTSKYFSVGNFMEVKIANSKKEQNNISPSISLCYYRIMQMRQREIKDP